MRARASAPWGRSVRIRRWYSGSHRSTAAKVSSVRSRRSPRRWWLNRMKSRSSRGSLVSRSASATIFRGYQSTRMISTLTGLQRSGSPVPCETPNQSRSSSRAAVVGIVVRRAVRRGEELAQQRRLLGVGPLLPVDHAARRQLADQPADQRATHRPGVGLERRERDLADAGSPLPSRLGRPLRPRDRAWCRGRRSPASCRSPPTRVRAMRNASFTRPPTLLSTYTSAVSGNPSGSRTSSR